MIADPFRSSGRPGRQHIARALLADADARCHREAVEGRILVPFVARAKNSLIAVPKIQDGPQRCAAATKINARARGHQCRLDLFPPLGVGFALPELTQRQRHLGSVIELRPARLFVQPLALRLGRAQPLPPGRLRRGALSGCHRPRSRYGAPGATPAGCPGSYDPSVGQGYYHPGMVSEQTAQLGPACLFASHNSHATDWPARGPCLQMPPAV